MKLHLLAAALVAIGLAGAPAQAAPAKKKATTTKTAKRTVKKKTATKKKTTAAKAVAAPVPQPALTDTELALAQRVQTGHITCGAGQSVSITPDAANPGYFHVASGNKSYHMRPVQTTTGAMRLEDAKAGAVWLQLGSKSMLMNQKLGQRVANDCITPEQRAYATEKQNMAIPSLFD